MFNIQQNQAVSIVEAVSGQPLSRPWMDEVWPEAASIIDTAAFRYPRWRWQPLRDD